MPEWLAGKMDVLIWFALLVAIFVEHELNTEGIKSNISMEISLCIYLYYIFVIIRRTSWGWAMPSSVQAGVGYAN